MFFIFLACCVTTPRHSPCTPAWKTLSGVIAGDPQETPPSRGLQPCLQRGWEASSLNHGCRRSVLCLLYLLYLNHCTHERLFPPSAVIVGLTWRDAYFVDACRDAWCEVGEICAVFFVLFCFVVVVEVGVYRSREGGRPSAPHIFYSAAARHVSY